MHQAGILDAVRERVSRRRGGIAVFDHLSPRQTAHIVVDLQNGFMDHGQVAEVPMVRTIVPNFNRISSALRAAGGVVVYLQHTMDAEAIRTWPVFFEHFCGPEHRARMIETFTLGNPGHSLWSELMWPNRIWRPYFLRIGPHRNLAARRRVCRSHSQGRETGRSPGSGTQQIRTGRQS